MKPALATRRFENPQSCCAVELVFVVQPERYHPDGRHVSEAVCPKCRKVRQRPTDAPYREVQP